MCGLVGLVFFYEEKDTKNTIKNKRIADKTTADKKSITGPNIF
jgi:hypothetical protein